MKIFFSDEFKKELKLFGNLIKLSTFRLGKYTSSQTELPPTFNMLVDKSSLSDYFQYSSIWDEKNFILSTTLDLTVLPSKSYADEWITKDTVIFYYYSDINDNVLGIAFILTGDIDENNKISPLDLCTFKVIGDKLRRRDRNHINFYFPSSIKSNILTARPDSNTEFLERSSNIPGVNIFLSISDDESSSNDLLLTKKSFLKYVRDRKSLNNYFPLYLDGNGEKVFSSVNYKHYKSITISALNQLEVERADDTISYYIESNDIVTITGTVTYDLYRVSNGSYTLVKENESEDLTNTIIRQTNSNGEVLDEDSITDNYEIDQLNKQIKFKISGISTTSFKCSLVFNSEIGDTKGTTVEIFSNLVTFNTYAKWSVDYSTRFYQKDEETGLVHALLLFDNTRSSKGWDPEGEASSGSGTIIIYTDTEVNVEDINIEQEFQSIFNSYFSVKKKALGYNTNNQKYKYEISITTTKDNLEGTKWAPIDNSGESRLILNTIRINNLENDSFENVSFYCVQRVVSPLTLHRINTTTNSYGEDEITELTFPGELGVKTLESYCLVGGISNRRKNYMSWEYVENENNFTDEVKENDVILNTSGNAVVSSGDKPSTDNSITFYSRVSPQINKLGLGNFTFKRLNSSTLSYDPTDWEDVIYCHPDNNCTVDVSLGKDLRANESWEVDSKTKYFYSSRISTYRLYLFNRGSKNSQQFKITSTLSPEELTKFNNGELIFDIKYEDQNLFNRFFDLNFSSNVPPVSMVNPKTICVMTFSITPKTISEEEYTKYSWFPKLASGGIYKPISITISKSNNEEKFYCIFKPDFSDTLKFYDADSKEEIQSYEFEKDGGNKALYVASSVGTTNEFDYWTIVEKDPEVSVNYNNFGYNPTGAQRLVTNQEDISTWPNVPEAKTLLNTLTVSPTVSEYLYNDLVIRRATAGYSNIISYYKDWKNQLCEDNEASLVLKQKGQDYSNTLTIYVADENENLVALEKGAALELEHIGLYKIYIRSTSPFRIIIDGPNKKDNFYFFDSSINQYLPDILMKDISSFNAITGREICFAFFGNEENRFKVKEQTLGTCIRVINLGDETEAVVPLHRKYFEKYDGAELSNPVVDTNIDINTGGIDSKIFFSQSNYRQELIYTSYLETVPYIKYMDSSSYLYLTSKLNLNYNAFSSKATYTRNRATHIIKSRGNINSSVELDFADTSIPANSYPMPLVGVFSLENPEDFNGERKNLDIYGLIPKPQTSWYTLAESQLENNSLKLYYTAGSSTKIGVKVPGYGADYKLYYQEPGDGEWTEYDHNSSDEVYSGERELFKIEKITSNVEGVDLYEVTEGSETEYEGSGDINLGSIRIESYIDRNNFLRDSFGDAINFSDSSIFTQDYVNSLIPASPYPEPVTLGIKRKDRANSISSLTGDTSVISCLGESRTYQLHLLTDDEAYIDASLEAQREFISNMVFESLVGEVRVDFKSRLDRHNYSPIPLKYSYNSETKKYKLNATILETILNNYSGEKEETNLQIKTKTDTLELEQYQETWQRGIRLNGNLYMGLDNTVEVNVGYDTGIASFYVAPVILPTTSNVQSINSEFLIQGEPIIESQQRYLQTTKPNVTQSSPSFGYAVSLFNLPTNGSLETMGPYGISFYDGSGMNAVKVNVYVKPKDTFVFELYSEYKEIKSAVEEYNYVPESARVDSLIFSASGALKEPSTGVYLLTDAPESYCAFYINSSNMEMADSSVSMSNIDYYMNESIIGRRIGKCRREGETEDNFDLYHIIPTSKVDRFRSYSSTTINYLNYFGHKPYKGRTTIGIHSGDYNYIDLPSYYGVCTLSIDGPYITTLSAQLYDSTKPEDTQYYHPLDEAIIGKWVDFSERDDSEYSKYTTTNSHFLANSRLYALGGSGTQYYHLNNTIWINYTENSSSPKYGNLFSDYGYYCGFLFNVSRYEWVKDVDTSSVKLVDSHNIDKYCIHRFSDTGRLKLIDLNDTAGRLIYTDHLEEESGKRSEGNPYVATLLKYYSNYELFSSPSNEVYSTGDGTIGYSYNDVDDKYNYVPGILLDLGKDEFTETDGVYTITRDSRKISVTVADSIKNGSTEGTNTDSVTFYINISLYNMN